MIDLTKRGPVNTIRVLRDPPRDPPRDAPTIPTKFPTVETLGIYCDITGRVFNLNSARANGILEKLLKPVGQYFGQNARTNYLQQCAIKYAKNPLLGDIDVMMILMIETYYHKQCNIYPDSEPRSREISDRMPPVREERANLKKYDELFNAARSIDMARLALNTRIE